METRNGPKGGEGVTRRRKARREGGRRRERKGRKQGEREG